MNPALLAILLRLVTSKAAKRLVIAIFAVLAGRSDNEIDDEFVKAAAGALEIRVPDIGIPNRPDNENIFLGNDQLDAIKHDRKKLDSDALHEVV